MGILVLNQARANHRLVYIWFLKIDPVQIVSIRVRVCVCVCVVCVCICVCVCASAPEIINN